MSSYDCALEFGVCNGSLNNYCKFQDLTKCFPILWHTIQNKAETEISNQNLDSVIVMDLPNC